MLATGAVVWAAGFTAWALTAPGYSDGQTILEANPETTVRVADSKPDDGWGGWLGHLTLEMTS